ncbi:hypothetical protein [Crocosphaera sp. UHCC 0190]|uniref:hypothetical protein n=1 Tax=Crocosphaera sp. UHCC 0190 TaxID=3110246 RepID=UPI002B20C52B|nr:hypothetical protein [Crocosphaera sp. UHCC 0190]
MGQQQGQRETGKHIIAEVRICGIVGASVAPLQWDGFRFCRGVLHTPFAFLKGKTTIFLSINFKAASNCKFSNSSVNLV